MGPLALAGINAVNLACSKLARNSLLGKVAIVDRGTCDFSVKVKNVQNAGAIAAIVVNNVAGLPFTMGGAGNISIPSAMVGRDNGAVIKTNAGSDGTVRLSSPAPLMRDSALDSDIMYHEYGHGLTWRMIGGMSGPMAGAIGEGMGDVLAILINENDRVGEYAGVGSAGDPLRAVDQLPAHVRRLHRHGRSSRRRNLRGHRVAPAADFRRREEGHAAGLSGRRHELHAVDADLRAHARRHPDERHEPAR